MQLKNLRLLDVSCNRLTHLKFLSANKILHAQYNMIRLIDSCFSNLVNLTDVRLDANKIEDISPETFAHCKSLTDLDLSYNLLENIELLDADVSDNLITDHALGEGYPVIQRLNLANNQIRQIDDFDPIRSLASLNISNNSLQKPPNFHACFPSLETLEMTGNPLFISDELLGDLAQCEMLRELTLDDNTESIDFSKLQEMVSERVPQLLRMNNTDLRKRSSRNTDGMKQCYEHKKQVYDLIESQLAALTSLTAPLQASLDKSFDAVSQLFARVDEEMEKRTSCALTESVNTARSSLKYVLHQYTNLTYWTSYHGCYSVKTNNLIRDDVQAHHRSDYDQSGHQFRVDKDILPPGGCEISSRNKAVIENWLSSTSLPANDDVQAHHRSDYDQSGHQFRVDKDILPPGGCEISSRNKAVIENWLSSTSLPANDGMFQTKRGLLSILVNTTGLREIRLDTAYEYEMDLQRNKNGIRNGLDFGKLFVRLRMFTPECTQPCD
ncbi:hypothetical protein CLF_110834 [Clonorchis sinensis]|uniref:Protein phosphatase 1 regulatory subunit 7 n=1 Tax=Clonorchis sinensis TaxID=79923 RepID=G7YTY2_CLOSI|nr:hypothetical protein CLF_110834 [Clonorchis sinensis]